MLGRVNPNGGDNKSILWIETGFVLIWIAAPTLSYILCWLLWGSDYLQYRNGILYLENRAWVPFAISNMGDIFINLREVLVVLFIMWRSEDEWFRFGLVKPKLEKDFLIGFSMMLIIGIVHAMGWVIESPTHRWTWSRLIMTPVPIDRALLILAASLAIGFSEELTLRGYIIPRFETLIGSTWKAIILSAIVFGLLHMNKGVGGVVTSCLSGVIWGIGFCATRRIWPVVISHALWDFVVTTHLVGLFPS